MQASYQIRTSYENNFTAGLFVSDPSRKEADARIALLFPSSQTSAIVFCHPNVSPVFLMADDK